MQHRLVWNGRCCRHMAGERRKWADDSGRLTRRMNWSGYWKMSRGQEVGRWEHSRGKGTGKQGRWKHQNSHLSPRRPHCRANLSGFESSSLILKLNNLRYASGLILSQRWEERVLSLRVGLGLNSAWCAWLRQSRLGTFSLILSSLNYIGF